MQLPIDTIATNAPQRRVVLPPRRAGFTLLEVMLALALAAAVAALIGGLVQIFLINQDAGSDNVRQAQLARSILNMIAEDIRTTVRHQEFDTSGLQQLLSGSGGGMSGGMGGVAMGGGTSGGMAVGAVGGTGGVGGATTGGSAAGASLGGSSGAATGSAGGSSGGGFGGATSGGGGSVSGLGGTGQSGASSTGDASTTSATPTLPAGIYGSATSIEIDISRLPRPDEYYPQQGNVLTGSLGDMPSDIKTIGYYVQAPRSDGIQDPLAALTAQGAADALAVTTLPNGGLVRRSVDRAVTQYAYNYGQSDRLMKTGELVAPEVVAIEFSYFDGTTWLTQWDSSQLGLPKVVRISLALQKDSFARTKPVEPGVAISSLTSDMMQEHGIQIYSINTIIPGAALLVAPQGTTTQSSAASGMGSVGL